MAAAEFNWEDPLDLESQLTDEERMIQQAAHDYCQDRLMSRVEERIADSRVLTLIRSYLDQGVMDELTLHEPTDRGTPQGAVISPLLANIYLDPLDHLLAESGVEMVRYADDFVVLCQNASQAQEA